jgi:hypothetical protein
VLDLPQRRGRSRQDEGASILTGTEDGFDPREDSRREADDCAVRESLLHA